mgnify:CR=1 FL=1
MKIKTFQTESPDIDFEFMHEAVVNSILDKAEGDDQKADQFSDNLPCLEQAVKKRPDYWIIGGDGWISTYAVVWFNWEGDAMLTYIEV